MLGATLWAREVFADMGVYLSRLGTLLHNMLNIEMGERGRQYSTRRVSAWVLLNLDPVPWSSLKNQYRKILSLRLFHPCHKNEACGKLRTAICDAPPAAEVTSTQTYNGCCTARTIPNPAAPKVHYTTHMFLKYCPPMAGKKQ